MQSELLPFLLRITGKTVFNGKCSGKIIFSECSMAKQFETKGDNLDKIVINDQI